MQRFMQALNMIFERKKSQPTLLEKNFFPLEKIPDLHPDPILLVDKYKDIIWANMAAKDIFRFSFQKNPNLLSIVREPLLLEALAERKAASVHLDIAIGTLSFSIQIQHLPPYQLLIFQDITDARNIDRLRRDFIANISHELKTPLTSLGGFIETMQNAAPEDQSSIRDRFLPLMAMQVNRMQHLVMDLLSLSHIEMKEHLPIDEEISLREVVKSALEMRAGSQKFIIDYSEHLPEKIKGDAEELKRALGNLIDNALTYGEEPYQIKVTIVEDPTLILQYAQAPATALIALSVIDDGPGVDPLHIPRLTERFYRIDPARSQKSGGTGLGLAIVKHIIARHKGSLILRSEPGQGFSAICYFPLS